MAKIEKLTVQIDVDKACLEAIRSIGEPERYLALAIRAYALAEGHHVLAAAMEKCERVGLHGFGVRESFEKSLTINLDLINLKPVPSVEGAATN